jgi:nucleolar protein 15
MREYFSQFGDITKLRLSRNRRTGASKHFAFIEFASSEVAQIVAKTMDNYLMFGHILKCKFAPQESLHPNLWKGANKRFKKVPYTKIEKRALEAPMSKKQWEKKITKEQKKREMKAEKMKKLGYEMELPKLKQPGEVLDQRKLEKAEQHKLLEASTMDEGPSGAIELLKGFPKDEVALGADVKPKKKKSKNDKNRETDVSNTTAMKKGADQPIKLFEPHVESNTTIVNGINDPKEKKKTKSRVKKSEASSAEEPSSAPTADMAPPKNEKVKKRKSDGETIRTHKPKKLKKTAVAEHDA